MLNCYGLGAGLAWALLLASARADLPAAASPEPAAPATPREFYNAGTARLKDGKLREAEALLESALGGQAEQVQPPTLYNLGHVRFGQGVEELKKGPGAAASSRQGQKAAQAGDQAIRAVDAALADNDLQRMVDSYLLGRGARTELKAATAAVRRALETHRAALAKWQRASEDFKSAVELNPADADARRNAEAVDQSIAKLVDSIRQLQDLANALGNKQRELGEKLKQLKGRIPAPNMPPGASGDDEDEDQPQGPQPGQQEGPGKEGEEMTLSPEQAGWLLEGFKLDSDRRLPMSEGQTAKPKDRARPAW